MKASFEEAKRLVIAAIYHVLYNDANSENLSPSDIHAALSGTFSLGYTRRAINSLVAGNLVESDGDRENPFFTLSEEGLAIAERLPPLAVMSARFSARSLGATFGEVPASDRLVTLDHNRVARAEDSVTELVDALEQENGDPDQIGFRERIVGQIKAGRELIRSGEFRAYLLYEVLVRALNELINKHKSPSIVALANALLGAIVSQMLQAN